MNSELFNRPGSLAPRAGVWEGDNGANVAQSADRKMEMNC